MKIISTLILCFLSLSILAHEDWSLKNFSVDKTLNAPFIKHEDKPPYLAFNLKGDAIKEYFEKIDHFSYRTLKNRGESHITVITPPEFQDDLSKFISIQEINEIAEKNNIQQSTYKPLCIGKGMATDKEKFLETYYIVVESENLFKIRKEIAKLYNSKGGKKFDPMNYYPHITLGFTDRDLFESDGLIKNNKTCMKTLHISGLPAKIPGLPVTNAYFVDKNENGGAVIRGNAPLSHENIKIMKDFGISEYIIFKNDKAGEVKSEINGLLEAGISKEKITHINFDWKDNEDFSAGCRKFLQGRDLFKQAMTNNKKIFFHCTTGEDRTGALAAIYLLDQQKNPDIKTLFQNEMCNKGYEAGDPDKELEVVEKIRSGLTKTFIKTAFRVEEAKKQNKAVDEKICLVDPKSEKEFLKYSTQISFLCERKK
jgi:2'-5' RNA ligase